MTDSDPLDRLIDLAIEQAERVLLNQPNASILPTFVLEQANGEVAIFATPWESERDKEITVFALRAIMRKQKVKRYSFLSEAWMATAKPGQEKLDRLPDGEQPSQRPDRVEVVVISASNDQGVVKSVMLRMVRGEAGTVIRLDRDRAEAKTIRGRFADLLKPVDEQS
jgi:hypothetical protein